MDTGKHQPLVCGVADAAAALSVSRTTIYRLINAGKLRTVRIGDRQLIRADDIRAFVGMEEAA